MTDQKAPKSEQTRTLILETALRLFQERGFDKTTMRGIAKEAGVSVGNAYYYFESKEHLVQGFYDRIGAAHQAAVRPILDSETDLQKRLAGVLTSWLDIAAPYHEFASQFFKNAADPESPLSPFSPESEPARQAAIDIHREVLAGAKTKVPAELADVLPELMWLSQMGLVLYWVFDRSPNSEKTRGLAERGAQLTTRASSWPGSGCCGRWCGRCTSCSRTSCRAWRRRPPRGPGARPRPRTRTRTPLPDPVRSAGSPYSQSSCHRRQTPVPSERNWAPVTSSRDIT